MALKKLAVLAACGMMTGCAGVQSRLEKGQVQETIDQRPTSRAYVEAIGIGASDPSLPSSTQRKSLARDAAIVKAQYELLSMIKGVEVEGGITVDRALEKDSDLKTRLKETIRGAEILRSEFTTDGGCVVTLRLTKKRLETAMGVRLP